MSVTTLQQGSLGADSSADRDRLAPEPGVGGSQHAVWQWFDAPSGAAPQPTTTPAKPAVDDRLVRVRIHSGTLNVRSTADGSSKRNIIGGLRQGQLVDVIGHSDPWLQVAIHGRVAFIHSGYVEVVNPLDTVKLPKPRPASTPEAPATPPTEHAPAPTAKPVVATPTPATEAHAEQAAAAHDSAPTSHPAPVHTSDPSTPEKAAPAPGGLIHVPTNLVGTEIYAPGATLSVENLHQFNLNDREFAFKQQVYDAAIARHQSKIFGGVADADLVAIDDGQRYRKDLVGALNSMLGAMRAAIAAGESAGGHPIGDASGIGVTSGYRAPAHDRDLWDQYFQGYLAQTAKARAATGDPFGKQSLALMVHYVGVRKAPPGHSNHSNGTAVDLWAKCKTHNIPNSFGNQRAWRNSWHHAWLVANAAKYNYRNYHPEAWHWEYIT